MKEDVQPEKLLRVLELISHQPSASQRELAEKTGFSLGLINLTLKRLIETGHIKASALNRRKLEYFLTTKGLVEITNRTTRYIARTLETFSEYKNRIDDLLKEKLNDGHKSFALLGKGEVSSIVELILNQQGPNIQYRYIEEGDSAANGELILDCRLNKEVGAVGVSVLERLLRVKTNKNFFHIEKPEKVEVVRK